MMRISKNDRLPSLPPQIADKMAQACSTAGVEEPIMANKEDGPLVVLEPMESYICCVAICALVQVGMW